MNNNLLASDNFASGSLAAGWGHPSGVGWTTFPLVSGSPPRATPPNTSVGGNAIWTGLVWPNDQAGEVVIKTLPSITGSAGDIAIMLRWQTGLPSGYFAQFNSAASGCQINRYDNGVATTLATGSATLQIGDVWSAQVAGSCITLYQNGVPIIYAYDATYTAGYVGISLFDSNSINNSQIASFAGYGPLQQDGIWQKQGIVIPANATDLSVTVARGTQNPCIIYEGSPQLISPDSSGNVFKMWFAGEHSTYYAESTDLINWTRRGSAVIANIADTPFVIKVSGTYHYYGQSTFGANVQHWTSSDGISWSLQSNNVFPAASGLCYFSVVAIIAGTWYALYTLAPGSFPTTLNLATSSDGISWTPSGSNPVASNFWGIIKVFQIGSTYYAWGQSANPNAQQATRPGIDPGEGMRMQTTDFIHWTNAVHSLHHSQQFENMGGGTGGCYVSFPINRNGLAYMFYSAGPDDAILTTNSTLQIGVAIGPTTLENILTASEDGTLQTVTDAFARGAGGLGSNWTTPSGASNLQIVSSGLVDATALSTQCVAVYTAASFSNDQYAEITIATTVANAFPSPLARAATNALTFYVATINGALNATSNVNLFSAVNGSFTQISGNVQVTLKAGDVFRLSAVGSVISLYQNGFLIVQVIDSTISTGTPGMRLQNNTAGPLTNCEISNFSAGNAGVIPAYMTGGGGGGIGGSKKSFNFKLKL